MKKIIFSLILLSVLLTGCGKATIEKYDFIGEWQLQGSLATGDKDADAAVGLFGLLLNKTTGTDINDVNLKITKNVKVIMTMAGQEIDTNTFNISEDGKKITLNNGSTATLNDDKDILTISDENGDMDFERK